jgi:hypothetical protein
MNNWNFRIKSGTISLGAVVKAHGYSGRGPSKNNPNDTHIRGIGPIPVGDYIIGGFAADKDTGPNSIILYPCAHTCVFDRAGFRIHGDSKEHPGDASHGCIICPPAIRDQIILARGQTFTVLPE